MRAFLVMWSVVLASLVSRADDFPLKAKERERLASGFYATVKVTASNTGKITGKAELSNMHLVAGYGAQWVVLLLDKQENVLWISKPEHAIVDPAVVAIPAKANTSSKRIDIDFPRELVAKAHEVEIILTRYEKDTWVLFVNAVQKLQRLIAEVKDTQLTFSAVKEVLK